MKTLDMIFAEGVWDLVDRGLLKVLEGERPTIAASKSEANRKVSLRLSRLLRRCRMRLKRYNATSRMKNKARIDQDQVCIFFPTVGRLHFSRVFL